jgi:hypothetical protein
VLSADDYYGTINTITRHFLLFIMQLTSLYLNLYIAAIALPLAISADNVLSFAGLGADVDQVVNAPVKSVDKPRPVTSTSNGDDADDTTDKKPKMDTNNEQQQAGRVLKPLLDRICDQISSTSLLKQGMDVLSTTNYFTAKQVNPTAGARALVTALKTPVSLSAVLFDQSPLTSITFVSAKPSTLNDYSMTETTNISTVRRDDMYFSPQTSKKSGGHKCHRNKYENEEPIYCTSGSYSDYSLVLIIHPQVPFSKARALCRSQEMDLALADVSVGNFVESTSLAFRCNGAFSATWIRSYNGDTHEHSCLALFTSATAPGGSVNIPDSCKKHLPTLCKEV